MTNDRKRLIPPSGSHLPASRSASARPSLPTLPSSGRELLFGTPTKQVRVDQEFVDAHTAFLQSRAQQAAAARELVDARIELHVTLSKLATLPELCVHDYVRGKLERTSEIKQLTLKLQTAEVHAEANLVAAQRYLGSLHPEPPPPPPAPPPAPPQKAPMGLTPAEVEKIAQAIPELKPDTIQTLVYALGGLLAEKNK